MSKIALALSATCAIAIAAVALAVTPTSTQPAKTVRVVAQPVATTTSTVGTRAVLYRLKTHTAKSVSYKFAGLSDGWYLADINVQAQLSNAAADLSCAIGRVALQQPFQFNQDLSAFGVVSSTGRASVSVSGAVLQFHGLVELDCSVSAGTLRVVQNGDDLPDSNFRSSVVFTHLDTVRQTTS